MKNNMIKQLALRAKNRMMNRGSFEACYDARIKVIDNEDKEFVERVRKVLANENPVTNPMRQLIDEKSYMKISSSGGREKYMLDLTAKFLKAKEMIENERLA